MGSAAGTSSRVSSTRAVSGSSSSVGPTSPNATTDQWTRQVIVFERYYRQVNHSLLLGDLLLRHGLLLRRPSRPGDQPAVQKAEDRVVVHIKGGGNTEKSVG